MRQQERDIARETQETCTKSINEPCRIHPVDCPNCENSYTCGQRKDMQARPDKIRSCPHFRSSRRSHL